MKFKIKKEGTEQGPEIELWLTIEDGDVFLEGTDERGMTQDIFRFTNGQFHRSASIELKGLDTDEDGRIVEDY